MHLLIQWRCKLRSMAPPPFVHILYVLMKSIQCKCIRVQYVTKPVCMCLPGPVNKLHICDT